MDRKGFTLVELLGAIIIIGVLALVVSISVTSVLKNSKFKLTNLQVKNIEQAAKAYYLKEGINDSDIEGHNYFDCVSVKHLIENDYIDVSEIKNPVNSDKMLGSVKITYDSKKYKYTYQEEECWISKSFAEDSWKTIVENVKAGTISKYKVGDTKQITLKSIDADISGTYTVRIANISTPSECMTSGFSQTACGFVIEFEDIISYRAMNSSLTNVGGWENSEMRNYINNEIYNAFPSELRNRIINTQVTSGHELGKTENYKTIDKIYLLSTREVLGHKYDTASNETRQLDYYAENGVEKDYSWWLRSACPDDNSYFYLVDVYDEEYALASANYEFGVSVAFRIG